MGAFVPPAVLILISAVAAWLTLWHPRLGISVVIITTSLLFLASLPVISARMMGQVEVKPPEKPDFSAAQAIVVLGGGLHRGDGNQAPDTLGAWTTGRLDLAAHAYRQLNLKVAVSGGQPRGAHTSEAELMKAVLEADFGVPVTWVEDKSRSTWENALFTKQMLQSANVTTILLVTDAWHQRRALWSFERAGLHAIAWPAPLTYERGDQVEDYLPSMLALDEAYHALHEAIGLGYYRLRY